MTTDRSDAHTHDDGGDRHDHDGHSQHPAHQSSGGHSHDEDGHDHSHQGGLRGVVAELLRPHSHDTVDRVDTELEANARGVRALKISFAVLIATALIQVAIIAVTGSVALLADTIHNFSDALTAIPLFIAFRLSRRPPNRRYTYGYRRAEDLAGLFVIAMITLSAVIAGYEAIMRLIHPNPPDHLGWLLLAGLIGFAGNELVALYRIRVGRQIGSAALVADGHHARTDGFTSLAVALGAALTWMGFERADPIVGLAISAAIFAVLIGAARQIFHRLMDAVDPDIVEQVEQVASSVEGVQRLGPVQVRWAGHRLTASTSIVVDQDLTVRDGHAVAEAVRHQLLHAVPHLDTIDVHVDPCGHDGIDPHAAAHHHVP